MKKIPLFLIVMLFIQSAFGQQSELNEWLDKYEALLTEHVKRGEKKNIKLNLVDYRQLSGKSELEELYNSLKMIKVSTLEQEEARLAFWINAYNFLTIYIVAGQPGIKSIKDLNTLFANVWNQKVIIIEGRQLTLDDIEHKIIRKEFSRPRIHFALVCAALSCPDLLDRAYRPELLKEQLLAQEKSFLSNKTKGLYIDRAKKTVYISKIFSWYGKDFPGGAAGWLADQGYLSEGGADGYKIKYLRYDWDLNGR